MHCMSSWVVSPSRPSTLLATRRCVLLKPAKGSFASGRWHSIPREKQGQAKTQRYDEGYLMDSPYLWVGRSVSSNVECARSPANLAFHVPQSGQCSAAICCGNWTGNSDSPPTSSLRRHCEHGSPISNVGCCSKKRSLVADKELAQVRTQRSRLRNTGSGSPNTMRRMRKTPSTNHVGVATSCASNTPRFDVATRRGLRLGFRVAANVENFHPFGGAHWSLFC